MQYYKIAVLMNFNRMRSWDPKPSRRCKVSASLLLAVPVLEATPHLLAILEVTALLGFLLGNLEATHSPIQQKVEELGGYHKLQGSHMTVAAKYLF